MVDSDRSIKVFEFVKLILRANLKDVINSKTVTTTEIQLVRKGRFSQELINLRSYSLKLRFFWLMHDFWDFVWVIQWYAYWIYELKRTDTYIHLMEQTQRHIEHSGISWSERWRAVLVYLSFPNRIIPTTQTFPRKKYLVRRGWTNHESMEILMTNSWSEFRFKNRDKKETHKNWHFIIVCLSIMSRIVFFQYYS